MTTTTVIKSFNASPTPKAFNINKILPNPTKFTCLPKKKVMIPPQKINPKRVSRVVAVANGDDAMKASGDVTPPTKPVGDNKVVEALKTVGEFIVYSVKAVVKIVITPDCYYCHNCFV
ncbi:hypothetical protein CTI12_AA077750 [Artemisia annua]|uniref:Uncharacterized protein n=1 Tax=Artemisia annua TaxID=35608 RepID=A0A2U1PM22_ARTAN|nr:hypothetical protein CTI12_AA077750 [Artemisia annua]